MTCKHNPKRASGKAKQLGLTIEEYLRHRNAGERWCSWHKQFEPSENFYLGGSSDCKRAKAERHDAKPPVARPYESDEAFIAANPHGAELELIGAQLGICKERVRQIEESAYAKARIVLGDNVIEGLKMLASMQKKRMRIIEARGPVAAE